MTKHCSNLHHSFDLRHSTCSGRATVAQFFKTTGYTHTATHTCNDRNWPGKSPTLQFLVLHMFSSMRQRKRSPATSRETYGYMKGRTVVSFTGVKIKRFWNIRTFGNVDATQLRRWGALRDLSHPLGSPRYSSSREGVRMRNPCYSRQAQFRGVENPKIYQHPVLMNYFLSLSLREPLFAAGDRVRGSCLLINRSTYLGFSMK